MTRSFSIKTKIFCCIVGPALILLVVVYLDYVNLSSLGRSAELILSKNYRTIKASREIRNLSEARLNFILLSLLGERETDWSGPTTDQTIAGLLQVCRENITEQGEEQIVDKLLAGYPQYELSFQSLLNATSFNEKPRKLYASFIEAHTAFNNELDTLISINERAMEAAEEETRKIARRAQQYSMTLVIAAILFIILLSYVLATRISRPLLHLAESLASVKEGSGDYPFVSVSTRDEIGFLTSEFNRLFERLKVYDQMSMDKLTTQKLKVQQAEKAKAGFIADLSHQLKTPMTSLTMSVGILAERLQEAVSERHAQLLETAREDCNRLSSLINELVGISRLDAMLKPWAKESLDIEEMINTCLKPLRHQAEEKGIRLRTEFEPGLPPIGIDPFRFPWVITNLVGNAIRYTDRGGDVTLRVEKRGGRFYFQCVDTGIGIEERHLPGIFDRFTQFSEREKMGTIGLGLAIVKDIIEQHGGDISVESKVGKGTAFTFWIPIQTEDINEESSGS